MNLISVVLLGAIMSAVSLWIGVTVGVVFRNEFDYDEFLVYLLKVFTVLITVVGVFAVIAAVIRGIFY